jgi:DNA-binding XRE family transcriptional regulator
MNYSFSHHLRRLRRRAGMTQKDLAFLLNCQSAATVCQYETQKRIPDLRTALSYQIIFGVRIEEIFPDLLRSVERDVAELARRSGKDYRGHDAQTAEINRDAIAIRPV